MKRSRKSVRTKATAIPELRFEDQRLTSFAGLVVIQRFFQVIFFKTRLQKCFRHLSQGKIFDRATIFTQLVIHVLLGFRELRDAAHYHDDPLVQRVLGLKHLPDVATISRMLKEADQHSVDKLRQLLTDMVLERIGSLALPRVTLDFDGSVQSTKRRAEGTAVGRLQIAGVIPPFGAVVQMSAVIPRKDEVAWAAHCGIAVLLRRMQILRYGKKTVKSDKKKEGSQYHHQRPRNTSAGLVPRARRTAGNAAAGAAITTRGTADSTRHQGTEYTKVQP